MHTFYSRDNLLDIKIFLNKLNYIFWYFYLYLFKSIHIFRFRLRDEAPYSSSSRHICCCVCDACICTRIPFYSNHVPFYGREACKKNILQITPIRVLLRGYTLLKVIYFEFWTCSFITFKIINNILLSIRAFTNTFPNFQIQLLCSAVLSEKRLEKLNWFLWFL